MRTTVVALALIFGLTGFAQTYPIHDIDVIGVRADAVLNVEVPAELMEQSTPGDSLWYLETYVMNHPYRVSTTPQFLHPARDNLQATLEEFGLQVVRHDYGAAVLNPSERGVNILAVQEGTTHPNQWVVLSAHFDTVESTVYGAWDDGAGIAVLLSLADRLQDETFPFTIVYAFFDEEEQGLIGSREFVAQYKGQVDLVANINTDPPGLNWPCADEQGRAYPVKVLYNHKEDKTIPAARAQMVVDATEDGLDAAGVPRAVRDYDDFLPVAVVAGIGLVGTSDHASFGEEGIANVFVGAFPSTAATLPVPITIPPTLITGGRNVETVLDAIKYPLHTPLDDLRFMHAFCPGKLGTSLEVVASTMKGALYSMADAGMP